MGPHLSRVLAGCLAVAATTGCAPGPCDQPVTSGASAVGEQLLAEVHDRVGAAAVGVALLDPGDEAPWTGAAGCADPAAGEAATLEHTFRVGGLTQLLTALTVHALVDDGVLALDTSPGEALTVHGASRPPTLRELLQHTAGVADYRELDAYAAAPLDRAWTRPELVELAADAGPTHDAGTTFATSHTHALLVDAWVEAETGDDIATWFGTRIAPALGLERTAYAHAGPTPGPLASPTHEGCIALLCEVAPEPVPDPSGLQAAASAISTPAELARLMVATTDPSLLSEASREALTPVVPTDDVWSGAGFPLAGPGVFAVSVGGTDGLGHTGGLPGYTAIAVTLPAAGRTAVVLAARDVSATLPAALLDQILPELP